MSTRPIIVVTGVLLLALGDSSAQAQAISYPDPCLYWVYPAGARRGQSVRVELGGRSGLEGADRVVIDGPPGITVRDVKAVNGGLVQATFDIAADAPIGRRFVRVAGGSNGLTGFRLFLVSDLGESLETEPNDAWHAPQDVVVPTVVNGRLGQALDQDCFRFEAKAGQQLTVAVLAHGMDSLLIDRGHGYVDASLEVLGESGETLAAAEDSVGLDPVISFAVPADGRYIARVRGLSYRGHASAVYRLTIGEVAYPTHVFPLGGARGKAAPVEWFGPGVQPGSIQSIAMVATGSSAFRFLTADLPSNPGIDVPFLIDPVAAELEIEPNDAREQGVMATLPRTIDGRFQTPGDVDWFRMRLDQGQSVRLEVTAQRVFRSPVDTHLEVFDAQGNRVAENDDGAHFAGQCAHDFPAADSFLAFTAAAAGEYFVRLTEQTGAGGPAAVYRLTAAQLAPDFQLHQWPDAVPIWGPGTTAALVVQLERLGGLSSDIQLRIEGLAPGWTGSVGYLPARSYVAPSGPTGQKALMTITAPADAKRGDMTEFRVVGTAVQDGVTMERLAQPLCLHAANAFGDRLPFRASPVARAVVAAPQDCAIESPVTELTVPMGGTANIPVRILRGADARGDIGITVDGETPAAGSGWRVPVTLAGDQGEFVLPLPVRERQPGTYGIVVSRAWASDLRAGRPGPCSRLILLRVTSPNATP